jgi:SAM-dependent methyltransferase
MIMHKTFQVSFRDPACNVIRINNSIFRFIHIHEKEEFSKVYLSSVVKNLVNNGLLNSFEIINEDFSLQKLLEDDAFSQSYKRHSPRIVLKHKLIEFPSYPYEWSSSMLFEAALITLDISEKILDEGLILKDATPFNVLFEGAKPVFVDLTSIEKRNEKSPIWLAYSQFIQSFLFPLFLSKKLNRSMNTCFLTNKEGVELKDCIKYASVFDTFSFKYIYLPSFFEKIIKRFSFDIHSKNKSFDPIVSKHILKSLYKKCRKTLYKLKPSEKKSDWSLYMDNLNHYSNAQFDLKKSFVIDVLKNNFKNILDVGCNDGFFSILAAKKCAKVVAIDSDSNVIDKLWNKIKNTQLNILPLIVNLCRPTPAVGWNNNEGLSFLKRSKNHFDLVMMLAVFHHMLVTERIPVNEIAKLASDLSKKSLIIEYVDFKDVMFQKLLRGRDGLFESLSLEKFKKEFGKYFNIEKCTHIPGSYRHLFFMSKKDEK